MNYEASYYRVDAVDYMRPDLVSYKSYGTVDYWWVILLVNNIDDAFHEIEVGSLLIIPNVLDIYDFSKNYKIRV